MPAAKGKETTPYFPGGLGRGGDCKPADTERNIMLMNYTKGGLNHESFNCLGGKRRGLTRKGAESNGSVACTLPFSST